MTSASLPSDSAPPDAAARQILSALVDGEAAPAHMGAADNINLALMAWRDDADARQAWHSYHLIGDALRSEDLAREPFADLAFLHRLRGRLDDEPAHREQPLAFPAAAPAAAPARRLGRWQTGFAWAAGLAVAAVLLLLVRSAEPGLLPEVSHLIAGQERPIEVTSPAPAVLAVNGAGVLRDPRLDEFLRMHQLARGGLAVGVPGGSLQRADLQMPGGNEQ